MKTKTIENYEIKKFVESHALYKIDKVNLKDPSRIICKEIVTILCDLYNKYGIKKLAKMLKITQDDLKGFLLKAGGLNLINYSSLKHKSKYHLFTYSFNSFKEQGEEFKKDLSEQIEKALKKYGSISKMEEFLEISRRDFLNFSFYKYGSARVPEIKRILGLRRPLKLKEDEKQRILKVKRVYDECKTLKETGQKLGVTKTRVWQILKKGEEYKLFKR